MNVRNKTFVKRFLGIMTAFFMVFTSVPMKELVVPEIEDVMETQAKDIWNPWSSWNPWGNFGGFGFPMPNVLTNATVVFKDNGGQVIDSIESGEAFKMVLTISANNSTLNGVNTYRLEVPESILLTNFRGNGFVDGVKYNGYTLHYNASTGERYVEFSIKNGATETIQLSGKFANGITENGTKATVKVVDPLTNKSNSSTIKAISKSDWTDNKTTSETLIETKDFEGRTISFDLSASPAGGSGSTGVYWADHIAFTDTIQLPEGLTFKSAEAVKNALSIGGVSIESVELSGNNTAVVKWTVQNTNKQDGVPVAEMGDFGAEAKLALNCIEAGESFESGSIKNILGAEVFGYKSNTGTTLTDKSASVPVKASVADVSDLKKEFVSVDTGKSYAMSGDTVTFRITNTNTGGKAVSDFTITEMPDASLEFGEFKDNGSTAKIAFDGNSIKAAKFGAGEKIDVLVTYKIKNGTEAGNIPNTVKNSKDFSSTAYVPVKETKTDFSIAKNADTSVITSGTEKDVNYRIIISNTGTTTLSGLKLTDMLDGNVKSANIKSITVSDGTPVSDTDLSDGLDEVTLKDLEPEQSVTVDMTVSLTAEGDDDEIIKNTATVTNGEISKEANADIKIHVGKPEIIANKNGSVVVIDSENNTSVKSFYQNGSLNTQDIVYTITVANNGDAAAKNVVVSDDDINTISTKTGKEPVVTLDGNAISLPYTFSEIAPHESKNIKITFSGVDAELVPTEENGTDLENIAKVEYNNGKEDIKKDVPDTIEVKPAQAIVGIYKFAERSSYTSDDYGKNKMWYHVKVSNTGTLESEEITVVDKLPEWLTDAEYRIKSDDGSETEKQPWTGSLNIGKLAPNTSCEIEIYGVMKPDTTGELVNTASLEYDGETKESSVTITETKLDVGTFEKTAEVISDGNASNYLDVNGGTIIYRLVYTGKNYVLSSGNKIPFDITFTDSLPNIKNTDGGYTFNVKSLKVVVDNKEAISVPSSSYQIDDNNVLTYVWGKNTSPDSYICDSQVVVEIECKVDSFKNTDDSSISEVENNASMKIADAPKQESKVTTPVVDKNAMKVDKFAKQEGSLTEVPDKLDGGIIDEETGLVSYGKDITYYVTITNNSEKPMYKLNVYDEYDGFMKTYKDMNWTVAGVSGKSVISTGDKFTAECTFGSQDGNTSGTSDNSTQETAKDYSAELKMFTAGGSNWGNAEHTDGKNAFSLEIASKDETPVLDAGGSVTFVYRLTTNDRPFYGGTNQEFNKGTNTVWTNYSGSIENLKDNTPFTDEINYEGSAPSLFKSISGEKFELTFPSNGQNITGLSRNQKVSGGSIADASIEQLTSQEYSYSLALLNESAASHGYSGENTVIVIEDAVPEGMQLVEDSVIAFRASVGKTETLLQEGMTEFTIGYGADRIPQENVSIEYKPNGKVNIVIANTDINSEKKWDSTPIHVNYSLRMTDTLAIKLKEEKAQNGTIDTVIANKAIARLYENYGTAAQVEVNSTNEAEADLMIQDETIAPDIKKTAEGVDDVIAPDSNWTTGAEWTIKITNKDLEDYDIADAKGFVVYDEIQAGSRFYGIATGDEYFASDYPELMKANYVTNSGDKGTVQAYFTKDDGTIDTDNPVTDPADTDGKVIAFDFGNMTLKKGEYVEITFCTSTAEYDEQQDSWITPVSSITNKAKVKFNNGFSLNTVSDDIIFEGDKTVSDSESYQIGGIITESYKTIEYKHSDLANSPESDKGFGDNIKHAKLFDDSEDDALNYVQGLQGDYVEYTINVKNDAATAGKDGENKENGASRIDRFSVIDRLPYVGDTGIVSGYPRYTAFPVELDADKGFAVKIYDSKGKERIIDKAHYTVSYSDSTATLNEFAGDWRGNDDVMAWYDEYDPSMINFRIVFDDTVTIAPQEYISIEFRGIVSPFTDITAEDAVDAYENDKIAWNSFAYSYQTDDPKTGLDSNDTVVSEPARVGVWVKKTDTEITVNKTYKTNSTEENTFYFSLFEKDGENYKLFGQPKAVTMTGSQEGVTETIKFSNLIAKSTLYLFETDKEGNILKSTPEQKITYGATEYTGSQEIENALTEGESNLTVDITNEVTVGKINLTKTFVPADSSIRKTFCFGAFMADADGNLIKEDGSYRRIGDVQSLSIRGGAAGSPVTGELSFANLPIAGESTRYYILETDARGNIAPDALDGDKVKSKYLYNAPDDSQYNVTGEYSADLTPASPEKNVSVKNTEKRVFRINVSKTYDGKGNDTFKVGIFEIARENELERKSELTDKDYDELDSIDRTDINNFTIVKDENGTDLIKEIKANSDPVAFDIADSGNYYVFEVNADNKPIGHGTKIDDDTVKYNESANITAGDDGYKVSYTPITLSDENTEENISIENTVKKILPVLSVAKVLSVDGYDEVSGKAEYTFGVFESEGFDDDGNAIISENPVDVKVIDPETGKVSDKAVKTFKISVDAVNGKSSTASAYVQLPEIEFTDLDPKIYYVFEVDKDGNAVKLGETIDAGIKGAEKAKAVVNYSPANGVLISQTITDASAAVQNQVTKHSEISFVKWNDKGDILEGAVLQLTGEGIPAGLENVVYAGEKITANGEKFTVAENSVAWTTGKDAFVISDIADGEYTLSEIYAPEGYVKAADKTFTVEGGYINTENLDDDTYTFTANSVSVMDKEKVQGITISKKDITGENEVKGAVLTIKAKEGTELGKLTAKGAEFTENKDGDTVVSYSFVSNGTDVTISGLSEGTYILEETSENGKTFTAEDGNEYTIIDSALEFTVDSDGNITETKSDANVLETADNTQKDGYYVVDKTNNAITVCDAVKNGEIIISKNDAVNGEEISGAELTINKVGEVGENNAPVYTDTNGETIATSAVTAWVTPEEVAVTETTVVEGETPEETSVSYVAVTGSDGKPVKTVPTTAFELDDGVYELVEVTAPDGYKVAEKVYFAVKDGKVIYSGAEKPESEMTEELNKVTMLDQPSKVVINKADITGNTEVEGAKLTLKYKGEGDISKVILTSGGNTLEIGKDYTIDTAAKTISWTSMENAVEIEYIPNGEYELRETGKNFTSSDGKTYKVIDSAVTFIVENGEIKSVKGDSVKNEKTPDSNGYVYYNADDENITDAKNTITLCDAENTNKISISKQDAVTGKLIDGAKLTVSKVGDITENGDKITVKDSAETSVVAEYETVYETVTSVVTDSENNTQTVAVTDENGEVVTTIADKEFELTDGLYELTEISAPEGYQVAETIYFVVKDGKVVYSDTVKPEEITAEDMGNKVVMKDQPNSAVISKQDVSNGSEELAGAVISITAPENADLSHIYLKRGETYLEKDTDYTVDKNKITFTSGDEKTIVYGLASGDYKLTEDTAPLGYTKDTEIDFTINDKGIVESGDVIVKDEVITVNISKKSLTGSDEIENAELTLTNLDKTSLENVEFTKGKGEKAELVSQKENIIVFVSGTTESKLSKLPAGNYELKETRKPDGYELLEETIKFTVNTDGTIKLTNDANGHGEVDDKTNTVIMRDEQTSEITVNISKQDINGAEVKGAELEVYTVVTSTDESGNTETVTSVVDKWTSNGETHTVSGLEADKEYTLKEVIAPEGYKVATEIKFTVDKDNNVKADENSKVTKTEDGKQILVMEDDFITVNISKKSLTGSDEIENAELTLTNLDKTSLENVEFTKGKGEKAELVSQKENIIVFVSGTTESKLS
ncbi:MAG: hypothetical protein IJM19_05485, partial [Ruminococcus sp.]|nr:hypothetical protein [Ruminococcus sp.]